MGKGKELFVPLDSYIMLDLETTGLNRSAEILEIGMIKVRDRKAVATFSAFVRPSASVPPFITRLTGITDDMVKDAASLEEVMPWVEEFMEGLPVLAYNAGFDLGFLQGIHPAWQDVLALARGAYPQLPSHKLSAVASSLHLRCGTHRALDDCVAAMDVYEYTKLYCKRMQKEFSAVYRAGHWKRR